MSLQFTSLEARGGQANPAVVAAIKNLTDTNSQTRWQAARALREMGGRADASVAMLVQAIEKHLKDTQVVPEWGDVADKAREAIVLILRNDRRQEVREPIPGGGSVARLAWLASPTRLDPMWTPGIPHRLCLARGVKAQAYTTRAAAMEVVELRAVPPCCAW